MYPILINKTNITPAIHLDKVKGIFEISGKSLPENAIEFYQPTLKWFEWYIENPNPTTTLVFELDYFNSASSKIFISILRLLEYLINKGLEVDIMWRYYEDDEDTMEIGKDYAAITNIPFIFAVLA